jgi:hypothetical protein
LRLASLPLALMFAATALSGCRHGHVELLASTRLQAADNAWDFEAAAFQDAVSRAVAPGQRLVIAPISDRSWAESSLFDASIPEFSLFGQNQHFIDVEVKEKRVAAKGVLTTLDQRRRGSNRTEIFSAVSAAANRFGTDEPETRKLLVILSTGFEQSATVNMADYNLSLDEALTDKLIRQMGHVRTMPRLEGVDVCMAGITAGQGRFDIIRGERIHRFWDAYFHAAGGRLASYGPTLQNCPLS